jgi:hypothetical protein
MRRRKIYSMSVRWLAGYLVGFAISMLAIFFFGHSLLGALVIWLGVVIMGVALLALWNEYMERWVRGDDG